MELWRCDLTCVCSRCSSLFLVFFVHHVAILRENPSRANHRLSEPAECDFVPLLVVNAALQVVKGLIIVIIFFLDPWLRTETSLRCRLHATRPDILVAQYVQNILEQEIWEDIKVSSKRSDLTISSWKQSLYETDRAVFSIWHDLLSFLFLSNWSSGINFRYVLASFC